MYGGERPPTGNIPGGYAPGPNFSQYSYSQPSNYPPGQYTSYEERSVQPPTGYQYSTAGGGGQYAESPGIQYDESTRQYLGGAAYNVGSSKTFYGGPMNPTQAMDSGPSHSQFESWGASNDPYGPYGHIKPPSNPAEVSFG